MLRTSAKVNGSFRCPFGHSGRLPRTALLGCLAALAGAAGQAFAADDFLKLVPEQALGFAVVGRPASADASLQELGQQMKLPVPSLLARLQGPGGIREGFDKERPLVLLVLPGKGDLPTPIVLAPVSDYAKFLQQFNSNETEAGVTKIELFGSPSLVRSLGDYAAITGGEFREALTKLKVADEVPAALAPWQTWLANEDAAGVVLAPGIRLISEKAQQGIAVAKIALSQAGDQAKQVAAALDIYTSLFKAAEKEVASLGIGFRRDAQGTVRICKRARLVAGGSWAQFVAERKPAEQNVLAGLPAGPFVFAGGGSISEAAIPRLMDWSFSLIKNMRELYGLSEEQAEAFAALRHQKFPSIRGFSFVLGAGSGDEPIIGRLVGLMRTGDSKTFLADYEKYAAAYNKIVEQANSPIFRPLHLEKIDVEGIPSLKVTMVIPQMANLPPQSMKMIESMYGPGGKVVARIVPCDEHTVIFSYADGEPLRRAIAAVKEGAAGLANDAGVVKTSALLPRGAGCCFYCSPKGVFDFAKWIVSKLPPPANAMSIGEFGDTPPVAVAVTTGADEVEVQVILPVEVIKEVGRFVARDRPSE